MKLQMKAENGKMKETEANLSGENLRCVAIISKGLVALKIAVNSLFHFGPKLLAEFS